MPRVGRTDGGRGRWLVVEARQQAPEEPPERENASMAEQDIPEHVPVDEARRSRLAMASLAVLMRPSATPLERQWAHQVWDLCWALADERGSGSR